MKYEYKVTKENIISEYIGVYETYGISVICNGDVINSVSDVTVDFEQALNIADLCNELELDPIHLFDVIEDMIEAMD